MVTATLAIFIAAANQPQVLSQTPANAVRAALTAKIAEVRTRLQAVPDVQDLRGACEPQLASAERAVVTGRYFVSLAGLRRCLPYLGALELAAAKTPAIGESLDAFRAEWERAGIDLKSRRAALGPEPGAGKPLAVRAMIESELSTFDPYYTSSRLYGENTTVESGLLYLGFPYGILDFVNFAASLPVAAARETPELPDLGGAMFALDGRLLDFYKAQTTPEMRSALIGTNSIFKTAQDLQHASKKAGALLEYLRTVESFGVARGRLSDAPAAALLRAKLSSPSPPRGDGDQTIAGYFIERATGLIAADEPGVDERRYAAAILDDVLPAYARAIAGDVPALTAPASATGSPVTVTLVRWPYT